MRNDTEITIIIVDDHPIVRGGLRQAIEREPRLKVLAEAGDGQTALELLETHQPQIIVLDIDMPTMDGFDIAREIINKKLGAEIVFLTFHSEEHYLDEALELGARGYVLKDSAIGDIASCLNAVAAGETYISPKLTTYLVKRIKRTQSGSNSEALSATERQVLKLLAEYKTTKKIAAELHVSPHTISRHRANIILKLNLNGSHALIKFALDHKNDL